MGIGESDMKKRNGFTLAELLGVITILGLLALLIIPAIDKTVKNSNETLYQAQLSTIVESAKSWSADHITELPVNGGSINITLDTLKTGGYITIDIENPKTKQPFDGNLNIKITEKNSQYQYKVMD